MRPNPHPPERGEEGAEPPHGRERANSNEETLWLGAPATAKTPGPGGNRQVVGEG